MRPLPGNEQRNQSKTEIDTKWADVAHRRLAEMRAESVKAVPRQDVFDKIWDRFNMGHKVGANHFHRHLNSSAESVGRRYTVPCMPVDTLYIDTIFTAYNFNCCHTATPMYILLLWTVTRYKTLTMRFFVRCFQIQKLLAAYCNMNCHNRSPHNWTSPA